jgi:hypothetical protein
MRKSRIWICEPLQTQIVRSSDTISLKELNLEWLQGEGARNRMRITVCSNIIQRQRQREATVPNHLLDPALCSSAVHSRLPLPPHLRADTSCRAFAYLDVQHRPSENLRSHRPMQMA